ncbi:SidA/IucD/PvdA family monooxygenase [Acinetobacter qingfengensis]|uniref:Alcaligin biosynthesis protein n=1 Tax=Acinetobacter qingfengensis TaxID=1262585 RepID=A0A1E7R8A3_9GAMM|nr:SidA/IucD/PvdA family monooxygenase [Acinetobacter qingfengensis]KAA8734710.1 SidA/IucD/PvdA family monooxygenase [Acinetobacter qingfengensis]OEY95531.1 alcaligin biosynthesis protein [Acinetobacter qingfengensis]
MSIQNQIYDIIGIGVGPFNLGLACLAEPLEELNTLFLDRKEEFDWHTGIMPEWSTLQIPFVADLVSFADPTSKFSFLNYLKETQKIYQFYIGEEYYILRSEYNNYCKWAVSKMKNINFSANVQEVIYDENMHIYTIQWINDNGDIAYAKTKNIVLGTGTSPNIPEFCKQYKDKVHLSSNYINNKENYQRMKSITIIGSGQSGAEIYYDLLKDIDKYNYSLNWFSQSRHFFTMDMGKLALEYTSPDYTEHFYSLTQKKRDQIIEIQDVLYKGISMKLIDKIYSELYIKSNSAKIATTIMPNSRLESMHERDNNLVLEFEHLDLEENFSVETNVVILSLGYGYRIPEFLDPVKNVINWDDKNRMKLNINYSVNNDHNIYVQNVGLYSHGISICDLGMGCYRNSIIINSILNKDVYQVEKRIAFQSFEPAH